MKNILFFIESLSGGGAEKVLVTLLNHIDYSKFRITLLTLVDTGDLKKEINLSNIDYHTIFKQSSNPYRLFWYRIKYKLIYNILPIRIVNKWIIPQKGIDTYIAFTEGFCTKILSCSFKQKYAWVHCDLRTLPWTINEGIYKSKEEEKKIYQKYKKVVCVSNSVKEIMEKEYGIKKTQTIYNPIDLKDIINKSNHSNNIVVSDGVNLISIGRLVPAKGYDLLIPVISKLIKEGVNVHLYILGSGPEQKKLENIIATEGIYDNIHLLGFQNNPYSIMKKMDLFVCSSRSEGYSLVIAEALTLGLPVISMNCSGPKELLDNNEYGKLCNNYEELYQVLKVAITDKGFYNELKTKAIKRKDFFELKKTIEKIENLLNL